MSVYVGSPKNLKDIKDVSRSRAAEHLGEVEHDVWDVVWHTFHRLCERTRQHQHILGSSIPPLHLFPTSAHIIAEHTVARTDRANRLLEQITRSTARTDSVRAIRRTEDSGEQIWILEI